MSANDQDGESMTGAHHGARATPIPDSEPLPVVRELQEVDAALTGLIELPVGAQVAVFGDLHQRLTAALAVTATAGAADESPRPRADDVQHAERGAGPQHRRGPEQHRPGPAPHRGR